MKILILFLTVLTASNIYGQTDSIEKAALYKKMLSKEIWKDDFSKIGNKWNETIKKINKYPVLPLNKDGKIQYTFLQNFKNSSQEKLYFRTLEWLSIRYNLIPAYLYSNQNDGKIIGSNNISLWDNYSGSYTWVITIKDEKILIEFANIGYQVTSEGYYAGDNWTPEKTNYYNIDQIFPIILQKPSEWDSRLKLLKTIDEYFNNEVINLCDYINSYDSKYNF